MKFFKGDILEATHDLEAIIHVTNLYHDFGGGIARQILTKFPAVFKADELAAAAPEMYIGNFTKVLIKKTWFYNLYAMPNIHHLMDRSVSYDAFYDGMTRIGQDIRASNPKQKFFRLGIPKLIGCGIAGGDWQVISKLLTAVEDRNIQIMFYCYEYDPLDPKNVLTAIQAEQDEAIIAAVDTIVEDKKTEPMVDNGFFYRNKL